MFSWRICLCFMSFHFVSKQRKTSNAVGMSSLIFWLLAKELRLSVCFNTFRNFHRKSNKTGVPCSIKITTEWTAEKWVDKRLQTGAKQNAQTQARQPNKHGWPENTDLRSGEPPTDPVHGLLYRPVHGPLLRRPPPPPLPLRTTPKNSRKGK